MEQNQRWRSPHRGYRSPSSWQSPRYRGSPGQSPNMGRYQSPRPQGFRPYLNRNSSPYEQGQSPQQYRSPYHRPRGWSPRHSSPQFFQDRSFSSPNSSHEGRHRHAFSRDDIENWVSPEMWADPWAELRSKLSPKTDMMEDEEIPAAKTASIEPPASPNIDLTKCCISLKTTNLMQLT
ncbi:unnamed protein product [Allacma fusca]|uniref:Uncharacterized protein n=1 Tax=Allacma fusca TaxID=39272 RepID=A0A8J2Q3A9_9HEXA|nr:unnamed protein product [Allacma fusca]